MSRSNNDRRRAAGKKALKPYHPETEGAQTAMVDLFTDVLHYASGKLTTPEIDYAWRVAKEHYQREEQNSEDSCA